MGGICSDCPPLGYPTDKTRCNDCPRRNSTQGESMTTTIGTDAADAEVCLACGGLLAFQHDHQPDQSGLDDGPYLPWGAPRKKPEPKAPEVAAAIRKRAWATRRERYGKYGHR